MISPRRQKVDQIRVQYPCHTSHCIFKFLSGQSLATFFTFFQSLNDLKMKERSFVLLLLFMIFSILTFFEETGAETTEGVTVRTKYGDIRGTVMPAPPILGSAVTKVNTFLGIPFAVPPVGELRFQPPKPAQAWKPKVYKATQFGKPCIQDPSWWNRFVGPGMNNLTFSEDCLTLNVYTPYQNNLRNPSTSYPVMVYIHGGGFVLGTANVLSPGEVLVQYGVILVTIQYRLGPFGFLTTGDSAAPGNYGMLDQVLALKWVNENIKNFGGDPNKVTIFGLSAGGASVGLHLLSPRSSGFFNGAISESGVDTSPWVVLKTDLGAAKTKEFAAKVGCKHKSHMQLVKCLRTVDAWTILRSFGNENWRPVVDSFASDNGFLPDTPVNLRRAGKFKKIPYMVGFMANEGALFLPHLANANISSTFFKKTLRGFAARTESFLIPTNDKVLEKLMEDALEFQYTPWGETADPLKLRQSIVDVLSDEWFVASSVQVCKDQSAHAPTYLFVFDYRSNNSFSAEWMGATHGVNLIIDFGFPFYNSSGLLSHSAADKNVSQLVMNMYTNFAKLGNPTPEPLPNGVQWRAFNSINLAYLHVDVSPEMRRNYQPHRMAFWNEYRPKLVKSAQACKPSAPSATGKLLPFVSGIFLYICGIISPTVSIVSL